MRKLNMPELRRAVIGDAIHMDWDMNDCVFPRIVYFDVDQTQHPDPFTPGSGRVCYHASIMVLGLATLDLGWTVTGEPELDRPFRDIALSDDIVRYMTAAGIPEMPRKMCGTGAVNATWDNTLILLKATAAMLAGLVAWTFPSMSTHFVGKSFHRQAQRDSKGVPYRWKEAHPINLVTLGWE